MKIDIIVVIDGVEAKASATLPDKYSHPEYTDEIGKKYDEAVVEFVSSGSKVILGFFDEMHKTKGFFESIRFSDDFLI